jgi:hypothetical protein
VKRSPNPQERDVPTRQQAPPEAGIEEREIDQILADSFPASDAPPWTLGVTEPSPRTVRNRQGRRG